VDELSPETISKITYAVVDEVTAWQRRPFEELYPIIYLDALVVKVREGHQVRNKAAHIAVGVDLDGVKHVVGIWVQATEDAKFWAGVCAELANRGVRDVLIVCCDGLTGFPEAIEATWPRVTGQTCVVHLIRASMRFVSYKDRKRVAAMLKLIYNAATVEAASWPHARRAARFAFSGRADFSNPASLEGGFDEFDEFRPSNFSTGRPCRQPARDAPPTQTPDPSKRRYPPTTPRSGRAHPRTRSTPPRAIRGGYIPAMARLL
jgi:hypothetical protein